MGFLAPLCSIHAVPLGETQDSLARGSPRESLEFNFPAGLQFWKRERETTNQSSRRQARSRMALTDSQQMPGGDGESGEGGLRQRVECIPPPVHPSPWYGFKNPAEFVIGRPHDACAWAKFRVFFCLFFCCFTPPFPPLSLQSPSVQKLGGKKK